MNYSCYEVEKLDPDTLEVLGVYNSIRAAARANYTDHTGIAKAARGERETSAGFRWKVTNKGENKIFFGGAVNLKAINLVSGETLFFESITSAARETGIKKDTIAKAYKRVSRKSGNFIFERVYGV